MEIEDKKLLDFAHIERGIHNHFSASVEFRQEPGRYPERNQENAPQADFILFAF